jgi:hypothetical protein
VTWPYDRGGTVSHTVRVGAQMSHSRKTGLWETWGNLAAGSTELAENATL